MVLRIDTIPKYLVANWPGTDQGLYSHIFLSGEFDIGLDYSSKIFQCFGWDDDPFIRNKYRSSTSVRHTSETILEEYKVFPTAPAALPESFSSTNKSGERRHGKHRRFVGKRVTVTSLWKSLSALLQLQPAFHVEGLILAEWKNRYTNITPAVLHFNGDGKPRLKEVYRSITGDSNPNKDELARIGYGCGSDFVTNIVYDSTV